MDENQFKIGDVVMLKSGSEPMTVNSISIVDKNELWCKWYDYKNGKMCTDTFNPNTLKRIQG